MIRFAHGAVHVSREHSISQYISMNPFCPSLLARVFDPAGAREPVASPVRNPYGYGMAGTGTGPPSL